ncbi:MAG: DUF4258 domain-containing protein [Chitinophagaceae bacterium]
MKKALPYIFLGALVIASLAIMRCNNNGDYNTGPSTTDKVNRNSGLDRRVSFLEYTAHATCRMACRKITRDEVQYILKNGTINYRKSEAKGRPCPTYALEGYAPDNQHLRVVFAQCDEKTKVVTCIDLDTEFECHCPGDENKNER